MSIANVVPSPRRTPRTALRLNKSRAERPAWAIERHLLIAQAVV